jgi:protein-disulfide isomerase
MRELLAATFALFVFQAPVQDGSGALQQILLELRQIRTLLETKLPGSAVPSGAGESPVTSRAFDVGTAPYLGSKEAPLTIVEFTDFQCPYCNRFFVDTFPRLKKDYIDTGKARFYSVNYPLGFHADAFRAAEAARCAADQNRFWQMHDFMQANPRKLEFKDLLDYARDANLEIAAFRQCVDSEKHKAGVQDQINEALLAGVHATPTFIVGKSTATGVDGTTFVGAEPYVRFDKMLQELLKTISSDAEPVQPKTGVQ